MLQPLQLGSQTFPVNLIQGPLAGVSCAPFRELTWRYSKPAFSCTEMISCKTIIHQPKLAQRFMAKHVAEGPVCFQLSANNPLELAEATKIVTQYGADLLDLNCGCPVKKIRSKGAGSSLLTTPQKLYDMIRAMKQNTHIPVSIKVRVQLKEGESFNEDIAKVVSDAEADFLVVHGRHWTEHYETPCRYEPIQFFVENLKIPVIGNGDIACVTSLQKMFATGCAGAMIGRAGVGQPWLIGQLIAAMQAMEFMLPSSQAIGLMLVDHVEQLAQLLQSEKFALIQARKFAKYYARHLENRVAFCLAINHCDNLLALRDVCFTYF